MILERLRAGVSTVIVGEAGIGKTALAEEVAERLRDDSQSPLFVAGGAWAGTGLAQPLLDVADAADLVIVLDDAHLFDAGSTRAVVELLAGSRTRIIATVRSGDRPLSPIGWLWALGPCERLALTPLGADDLRLLAERELGGDVDDALVEVLAERTRGNALLVEHLLRAGRQSGVLTHVGGVWQLTGELPLTTAAADLIRADIADLSESERTALQLVALAQPLRVSVAERVAARADLEALETRHLIAVREGAGGGEPTVSCAHPLYGELLRGELGVLRSRHLRAALLQAMSADRPRPDGGIPDQERLLSAAWRLDLGDEIAADELMACARLATTTQPGLAERLLRQTLTRDHAGPSGVEAASMLGHLLLMQGRVAEADQIVAQAESRLPTASIDSAHQGLAAVRVMARMRRGEITEGLRLVGAAPESGSSGRDDGVDLQTQALYAQLMLLSGRLDEALRITEPLLGDAVPDDSTLVARATAAFVVVAAYSFTGRTEDTSAALRRSIPLLAATREQVPYGMAMAQVSTTIGQVFAGHFAAAARLGQRMHELASQDEDPWQRPRAATSLGLVALYRGRVASAVEHLRTAIAVLTPLDAMFTRYNRAFLARAAALAGDLAQADDALGAPEEAPRFPLYEADWQIAEAAVLAARFRLDEAAAHAMEAARTAAVHGQWGVAAIAAHDAARYASTPDAARFLATAADLIDGPLPPLMREHAAARAAHDPERLRGISVELERVGATLFAAEAAYAAADAFSRGGDPVARAQQAARAIELHGRCEHAFLPWALGGVTTQLTARERQIALLAAGGHTDQSIGDQLAISIRTVQTHLAHVYTKLDVAGRGALATALTARPAE